MEHRASHFAMTRRTIMNDSEELESRESKREIHSMHSSAPAMFTSDVLMTPSSALLCASFSPDDSYQLFGELERKPKCAERVGKSLLSMKIREDTRAQYRIKYAVKPTITITPFSVDGANLSYVFFLFQV